MTTANVLPNVAGGFNSLFGNYIDAEIGQIPKPDNIILPLITVVTQPGTESIWYVDRTNEQGDASFLAEGGLKPLASANYQQSKKDVKEVAVRWKFSKRLMNHAPSVVADENADATQFDGLQKVAAAFIVPSTLSEYYTFANIYDVVMAVATQVRLANFKGQLTAILNTTWMAKMNGIKTTYGEYVMPDFVSPDGKQIGEVKIVFSNKIAEGDIVLGDLKKFKFVISENMVYDEGYENDDFSKNLVSRKLEGFGGTYFKTADAGAIVYDQIANILTDIEVPAE